MKKWLTCLLALMLCIGQTAALGAEESLFSDKDLTVTTTGEAIALNGETVTIDKEGSYVLTGDILNGSIRVALQTEGTVYLLLNGVTVHNDGGAALYTENCKKVVLTLGEGAVNTFTQGATVNEDEAGAITSKDDLTVNGTGTLIVASEYKDGVRSVA